MLQIPEITKIDEAFPADALEWMPPMDSIPDEFKNNHHEFCKIVSRWFYKGLSPRVKFYPKKDVNAEKAYRVIRACLGSYAPKQEHKMAATAYMLSQWFHEIKDWDDSWLEEKTP
jgi:hypothetical protein